jgi:uncharacterized protein YcbK (DUF882 family)
MRRQRLARAVASLAISAGVAAPQIAAQNVPDAGTVARAGAEPPPSPDVRYSQLGELRFHSINTREEASVRIYRTDGTVNAEALETLGRLFRDLPTGAPSPIVPRTMQLLERIATHFGVARLDVVSAYRSGLSSSGRRVHREGYHGVGSAVDFTIPGLDMVRVAAYARTFAHVGVGWYPRENFVHLDSRDDTFFWENLSRRRHHGWDRPLDRTGVAERDAAWTPADDAPWDRPGETPVLVLHPATQAGAHHHHAHHHHGRHAHAHPPLHVFHGAN